MPSLHTDIQTQSLSDPAHLSHQQSSDLTCIFWLKSWCIIPVLLVLEREQRVLLNETPPQRDQDPYQPDVPNPHLFSLLLSYTLLSIVSHLSFSVCPPLSYPICYFFLFSSPSPARGSAIPFHHIPLQSLPVRQALPNSKLPLQ